VIPQKKVEGQPRVGFPRPGLASGYGAVMIPAPVPG